MIKKKDKQKQYEYMFQDVNTIEELDRLGQLGWIDMGCDSRKGSHYFYRELFKKKKIL